MTCGGGTDLVGGSAQGVFEQSQQEFMFAIELQVEAPQRLAGPVDDLLDGEVGVPFSMMMAWAASRNR